MNFGPEARILVVAAHPDDEVLGCGGTIARARSQGAQVHVLFLGEGVSARFPLGEYESPEFREQSALRENGARKALASLGVEGVQFGKHLCCQFDRLPLIGLVKEVEKVIDSFKPTILLTHNPSEVNVDHKIVFEVVETACRPARAHVPSEIYGFEVVCSGNWTFESSFKPNVFVDISHHWDAKLKAWRCYEGEERPFPFPRSEEGLRTLAQFRGMASGLKMAEGFRLFRHVVRAV